MTALGRSLSSWGGENDTSGDVDDVCGDVVVDVAGASLLTCESDAGAVAPLCPPPSEQAHNARSKPATIIVSVNLCLFNVLRFLS